MFLAEWYLQGGCIFSHSPSLPEWLHGHIPRFSFQTGLEAFRRSPALPHSQGVGAETLQALYTAVSKATIVVLRAVGSCCGCLNQPGAMICLHEGWFFII